MDPNVCGPGGADVAPYDTVPNYHLQGGISRRMDVTESNELTLTASIVILGISSPWVALTFAFPDRLRVGSSTLCTRNVVLFSEEILRVNWRVQNAHEHAQRTTVQNIWTWLGLRSSALWLI